MLPSPPGISSMSRLCSFLPLSAINSHSAVISKSQFKDQTLYQTRRRFTSDWARRHINDPYVRKSVKDGYRCRSAYKLLEVSFKFTYFL